MSVDSGLIRIDSTKVEASTNCTIEIILTDSSGASSSYSIIIRIDVQEEEDSGRGFFIEDNEQDSKTKAFDAMIVPHSENEVDEQSRKPITMNVSSFGIEGEVVLSFSETLYSIEEQGDMNLTFLNEVRDRVLSIRYHSFASTIQKEEEVVVPELLSWTILGFSSYDLELKLNFTEPLFVSAY